MQREFKADLTISVNAKGVIDLDTVKGCFDGMKAYPNHGCYALCYAQKIMAMRGFNFSKSVIRQVRTTSQLKEIVRAVRETNLPFLRIGTMGDPSYAWDVTLRHADLFLGSGLFVVIITKHWRTLSDGQIAWLRDNIIVNTSISALDTLEERNHRLLQYNRIREAGKRSVLRVVTCDFNRDNPKGLALARIQDDLLSRERVIDNPLRATSSYPLAKAGVIRIRAAQGLSVSLHDPNIFLGKCRDCKEMCGVNL